MSPEKVVIFEDEFILANDLKRQISPYNYEVTAMFRKAEDGLQYLAGIQNKEDLPAIILMDISLAGKMNGIEAAEIITHLYDIALVFLTGMSQVEIFEKAFKTKPYAFLIKPFDLKQALISIRLASYLKSLENKVLKNQEAFGDRFFEQIGGGIQVQNQAEAASRIKLSDESIH
jgi:DNA-binding NtrC family response regulator